MSVSPWYNKKNKTSTTFLPKIMRKKVVELVLFCSTLHERNQSSMMCLNLLFAGCFVAVAGEAVLA